MSTFKTKQCKQLMETMFCPYGTRCQYIHNPMSAEKQRAVPHTRVLAENEAHVRSRLETLESSGVPEELSDNLFYISVYYK